MGNKTNKELRLTKSRAIFKKINNKHIAIIKDRKSRIIMKDGEQILGIAQTLLEKQPAIKISLSTSAPVCSKTAAYLKKYGIDIIPLIK